MEKCSEGQVYLLLCFFNCGGLLGGLVFGTLGDKLGRRPALLIALLMHEAASVSLTFFQNYVYFAVLYVSEGIFITGVEYLSLVLLLELLPVRYHLSAVVWNVIFRSTGTLIFSLMGWLVKNWYYLQLAVSLPGVTYLVYIWALPHSFHWLLSKNRFNILISELERVSGLCRQEMTAAHYDRLNYIQKMATTSRTDSINRSAKVTPTRQKVSVCLLYVIWLCVGLTFTTTEIVPQIKDSRMFILFGKALVTIGVVIFSYVVINRIGPKIIQGLLLVASGIFCISSVAIEEFSISSSKYGHRHVGLVVLTILPSLLSVMSTAVTTAMRASMLYFSAKTFVTSIRCFGVGTCNVWERIGYSVAPFLHILMLHGSGLRFQSVCGILMLISAVLTCFLPDYWKMDLEQKVPNEDIPRDVKCRTGINTRPTHIYSKPADARTESWESGIEESDSISFSGYFPHTRQCHLRNVDETLV